MIPSRWIRGRALLLETGGDHATWCCRACGMKRIFRFKVLKVGSRELYTGRCMYLVSTASAGAVYGMHASSAQRALLTPALRCIAVQSPQLG